MIPKIIHYCWFGEKVKPKLAEKCIASWNKQCPDWEIVQWSEENVDLSDCPRYVQDAYQAKKYAYVTDYIRLKVLYEHGGFYLDTDVELMKPLDAFCTHRGVIGFENDQFVNSGQLLAAEAGHPVLEEMMVCYHDLEFYHQDGRMNLVGCPHVNTDVLEHHGLIRNGQEQTAGDFHIYPAAWFNPLDSATGILNKTEHTVSIHWYSMSWIPKWKRGRVVVLRLIRKLLTKMGIRKSHI